MPYRIDIDDAPGDAFERLVELGALDVEIAPGRVAAILPDAVGSDRVATALACDVRVTPAQGRDSDSVWVLSARPVRAGRLLILPAGWPAEPDGIRMHDGPAFGTGLHPTTALCLAAIYDEVGTWQPERVLDVGTGSGILALAALHAGVARAVALDIDAAAVRAAAANARLNGVASRLGIVQGGPESVSGAWPLVVANVLTAPLMEMAPVLVRRVGHAGRLVLSGIRTSLAPDVESAYTRRGMRSIGSTTRDGWSALTLQATW